MSSRWTISLLLVAACWIMPPVVLGAGPATSFSGDRAMEWVDRQCNLGPRFPGSVGNLALREMIASHADSLGLSLRKQCVGVVPPLMGQEVEICNLVVSVEGGGPGPRIWLGAHFDTRPQADLDPDHELRSQPLVGANDGASGVAVLLHLMELLAFVKPAVGVDFLFFDGEDSGQSGSPQGFCLGSRAMAESFGQFGSVLPPDPPRGLIVLDMIGDKDLAIPMEAFSLRYARAWTLEVFHRAATLGLDSFEHREGSPVYDDHVPFLELGIPAVDLIDFDFHPWHTTGDVPSACSAESLAEVGSLVLDLVTTP